MTAPPGRADRTAAPLIERTLGWLGQNWLVALAGALAGALLSTLVSLQPTRYSSEALVALARQSTIVQFDPNLVTTAAGTTLALERRQALVELVPNDQVELDAIRQLKGSIPRSAFQPGELAVQIKGILLPRSEIISISATADAPDEAVAIASAWSKSYVNFVNHLYASPPGASIASLEADRDQAGRTSQIAQSALETNLQTSRVEALMDEIQQRERELQRLAPPTVAGSRGSAADYQLRQLTTLNDLGQTLRRIDAARLSVQVILDASPGESTTGSSETALAVIKAQLVSITNGLPPNLGLSVPNSEYVSSRAELQALLVALAASRAQVAAQLDEQRSAYESQVIARTAQLNTELQGLRSELDRATAERNQLITVRDLSLNTYTVLAKKATEQRVADAFAGREVEIASEPAVAKPVPQSTLGPRLAGIVVGAGLAAAFAWLIRTGAQVLRRRTPSLGSAGKLS